MREKLFLLIFALPAFAVSIFASMPVWADPSATSQTLRVDAIPFKLNLDPEFEFRDSTLTLKEYNDSSVGAERFRVLWMGTLAAQPQRFILETTATEATLEDQTGKALWVQHFEQPSLTLTLDKATTIGSLTDQAGRTLWTGPWDGKLTSSGGSATQLTADGFELRVAEDQTADLADSTGKIVWSGVRPRHAGLALVENGKRRILGLPALPFPANTKISFEIAAVPETVTMQDSKHSLLGTETASVIQITKRYSAGYYADHPIISLIRPDVMPRPLTVDRFFITFQDATGQTVLLQTLDVDSVRTAVLPGGQTLEIGHYHRTALDKQGHIVEDISSTTQAEVMALP